MKNAVSGVGLAPDAAMVTFPIPMFLPGSDLSSLKERRREFYDGLTRWKSEFAQAAGIGQDARSRGRDLRGRARQGKQPSAHPPVGRRPAAVAGDEGARGLDTPRLHGSAHARARQVPAARRHHHRRDLRHRARHGRRAARVPAGARRRRRGVPRSGGLRPAAGHLGRAVPGRHRQRADREADPPQLGLRSPRAGPAAPRRGEHRARAAPPAAERGRRAAGCWHDGDFRRHALHQRGLRRGRGGAAAGLAAARDPPSRLRAGHELGLGRLRERGHQRPAPRREEGDARKRTR